MMIIIPLCLHKRLLLTHLAYKVFLFLTIHVLFTGKAEATLLGRVVNNPEILTDVNGNSFIRLMMGTKLGTIGI